jgi:hypothetical protein
MGKLTTTKLGVNMQDLKPDSWRINSARFCGTHTTDEDVASYWLSAGEAYPLYKRLDLPKARGLIVDHESPNKTGVLIMFERQPTNEELQLLHDFLS